MLGGGLVLLGVYPQEPVRRLVERRLQQAFGPDARIGALRLRPGRLQAEIDGLLIATPAYTLEAAHVRLSLRWATVEGHALAIRTLEAHDVTLQVRTDAPAAPASSGDSLPIVVENVVVTNGTIDVALPRGHGRVRLDGVALQGGVGLGVLTARAAGGLWEGAGAAALGPLEGRLRVSPALGLEIESFDAGLARSRVSASGKLGRVGHLAPDLAWTARLDLAELAAPLDLGDAAGFVRAHGTLTAAAATAEVEADALRYGTWAVESASGRASYEHGVTTATLDARLLGGAAHVIARHAEGSLQGQIVARAIELGQAVRGSGLAGNADATVDFEGDPARVLTVEGRVTADGRAGATPFRLTVEASGPVATDGRSIALDWAASADASPGGAGVRLQASGRAHGAMPPSIEAHADGAVTTAQAGTLPFDAQIESQGEALAITGAVRGLGEPIDVHADLEGSRFRTLRLDGAAVALDRLAPGLTGVARVTVEAAGPPEALTGRASVQLEDAAWREIAFGPATLEATARAGAADVALRAPDWNVEGHATIAAGRDRLLTGRIDLRDTPLDRLGPLLPAGPPLTGTLAGTIDVDVPLARAGDAAARAEVTSLDLTRGALHVRTRDGARLAWNRDGVAIERLVLDGDGFDARATGHVALNPLTLDLQVDGASELDTLPAPEGWTLAGRVDAEVHITGSTARPGLTGALTFEDAGLMIAALPPLAIPTGRVELAGDALVLPDLRVESAGGTIVLAGRVPLPAAYPPARRRRDRVEPDEGADVRIAWQGLRVEEWPQAGQTALMGTLQGALDVTGGLAGVAEMRARLDVPATALQVEDVPVTIEPFLLSMDAGRVRGDAVRVSAAGSTVELQGGADVVRREVDVSARGALNLRALSPFVEAAALSGTAALDLSARGDWRAPEVNGSARIEDASVRLRLLPQALTSVRAEVVFDASRLRVPQATATLGGGDITMSGTARLEHGVADAEFTLTGRDVTLAYPPGLRSRLDADLTLSGGPRAYLLGGDVRVVRGLYDLDVAFEQSLAAPAAPPGDSPALGRFGLDLRVEIENAVQVRNNMADLQAVGAITVRGDMNSPAPVGTLEIEPAGKVYVGGRAFEIESGALTYRGNWDPAVQIEAKDLITSSDVDDRSSGGYEVTVRLVGSLERPGLQLASDPPLPEGQIVNLIAVGSKGGGNAALRVVGGQAAMLLAGRFTRRLRDLGFDEVQVQPELVAREGQNETGARFTFGKRLSSRLDLVYSLSLQDPEARFILLEARPGLDVVLRGQRSDAGTYTGSVGQRFQFGGPQRRRPAAVDRRVRITDLRFDGPITLPAADLARLAKTTAGQRKTMWDLQDDADRLRERLVDRGYIEAETSARFEDGVAVFRVRTGALYDWRVEGMSAPPDLRRAVHESLFEGEALDRGRQAVLEALRRRGHLRAKVSARVEADAGRRTLVFAAEPGPRYDPIEVVFPGARALSAGRLAKEAGGAGRLLEAPGEAVRAIEEAYHRSLHLAAAVDPPRVEEISPGGLRVVVPVREGPRARVGAVRFAGATRDLDELARAAGLRTGAPYDPEAAVAATDRIRERYFRWGYGTVRVQAAAEPAGADVDLVFTIDEGRRSVLGAVVIQGLKRTRESLVRKQVRLRPGAPLDPRRLARLERRLLDMGLFSRVVTNVSSDDPATLTITLEEDDRYFGRYAYSYEQKRTAPGEEASTVLEKSTAEVDAEVRNLLGWGAKAGARLRVGADVRDASGSLDVPSLPLAGNLTGTLFRIQQDTAIPPGPNGERRESQSTQNGFELSLNRRLPGRADLLYGYRFEDTEIVSPDFAEPQRFRTAVLRTSAIRDTRDSVLDARRGRFLSLSVDYAPAFLRSDFTFVKGAAQAFLAHPVGTSFTWAHGYRLALGVGFGGQNIRSTERFRAGGANSIRGFETDSVGPFDALTQTFSGGEALVVVNQELRYRHPSGLGAALFYDGGNVFAKAKDFDLDWRHALGVGLRWESPVGLLRMDLGIPLARRVLPFTDPRKESAYQVFFSLGQAF